MTGLRYFLTTSVFLFTAVTRPGWPSVLAVTIVTANSTDKSPIAESRSIDLIDLNSSAGTNDDPSDPPGPPDHVIPYSEHDEPPEPATRPNYTAPGDWAKLPGDRNVSLDFVPSTVYAQVRGTHEVTHLPRQAALASAETSEERAAAERLREVVKTKKVNTVYSEEGYEDAAYDHAGHARDADFHEGFARKHEDEQEAEGSSDSRRGRKRPSHPRRRPRKRSSTRKPRWDNSLDDYEDHLVDESRRAKTKTTGKPKDPRSEVALANIRSIKRSLGSSAIDPKNLVEHGMGQLEADLEKESREMTTEAVNLTMPSSDEENSASESTSSSDSRSDEVTRVTTRPTSPAVTRTIYTIRPRKIVTTIRPRFIGTIIRRVGESQTQHDLYPTSHPGDLAPVAPSTTIASPSSTSFGNIFWNYYSSNPNFLATMTTTTTANQPIYVKRTEVPAESSNDQSRFNSHGPYMLLNDQTIQNGVDSPVPYYDNLAHGSSPLPAASTTTSSSSSSSTGATNENSNPFLPKSIYREEFDSSPGRHHQPESEIFLGHSQVTASEFEESMPNRDPRLQMSLMLQPPKYDNRDDEVHSRPSVKWLESKSPPQEILHHKKHPGDGIRDYDVGATPPPRLLKKIYVMQKVDVPMTKKQIYSLRPPPPIQHFFRPVESNHVQYRNHNDNNNNNNNNHHHNYNINTNNLNNHNYNQNNRLRAPVQYGNYLPISLTTIIPILETLHRRNSYSFLPFRRKRSVDSTDEVTRTTGSRRDPRSRRRYSRFLNAAPKIADEVINKEIDARFKKDENSDQKTKSSPSSVEIEIPELDDDVSHEDSAESTETIRLDESSKELAEARIVDPKKYPFYNSPKVQSNSPLKYAVNPRQVPRKTLGGMEFYDSRNSTKCDDYDPNLEKIVPEGEELNGNRGPRLQNDTRLGGLGDKLTCYKAKYFGKNPLDNPIFQESIEQPVAPAELNRSQIESRLEKLPNQKDEYVIPRGPKKPEYVTIRRRKSFSQESSSDERNSIGETPDRKKTNIPRFPNDPSSRRSKTPPRSGRPRKIPFQEQVYYDVMGTIRNIEQERNMAKVLPLPTGPSVMRPRPLTMINRGLINNAGFPPPRPFNQRKPEIFGLVPPPPPPVPMVVPRVMPYVNVPASFYPQKPVPLERVPLQHVYRIFKRSVNNRKDESSERDDILANITRHVEDIIAKNTPIISFNDSESLQNLVSNETRFDTPIPTLNNDGKNHYVPGMPEGKFGQTPSNASSTTWRGEPKYNSPSSSTTPQEAQSRADSTIIPVIVKPDGKLKIYLPIEPQHTNRSRRRKDQPQDQQNSLITDNPQRRYAVHEKVNEDSASVDDQSGSSQQTVDQLIVDFARIPKKPDHRELEKFMAGDPPGYDAAFAHQEALSSETRDSLRKDDSSSEPPEKDNSASASDEGGTSSTSTTTSDEEVGSTSSPSASSSDDAEEKDEEASGIAEKSSRSAEQTTEKPFERFDSRPWSPSENYEDDKYSDLGPRVNKPFFYHPPFEVPDYERKRASRKGQDSEDDGEDDGSTETTDDHEHYVFPWESDKQEGSANEESLGKYEFPWERRERLRREREKYEGKSREDEDDDEDRQGNDEDEREQRSAESENEEREESKYQSVYVPKYKSKYNTNYPYDNVESSSDQRPVVKFSNRAQFPDPLEDEAAGPERRHDDNNNQNDREDELDDVDRAIVATSRNDTSEIGNVARRNETGSNSTNPSGTGRMSIASKRLAARSRNATRTSPGNSMSGGGSGTTTTAGPGLRRRRIPLRPTTGVPGLTSTVVPSDTTSRRRIRGSTAGRTVNTSPTNPTLQEVTRTSPKPRRRQFRIAGSSSMRPLSDPTTPVPIAPSTGRTVEHRRRIAKEEIVRKTVLDPTDDEDDEDDTEEEEDYEEEPSIDPRNGTRGLRLQHGNSTTEVSRRRRVSAAGTSSSRNPEKIEKVTITMKETPEHVYETKEVDKDGVRGKFVTITTNHKGNSSGGVDGAQNKRPFKIKDAEIEEMRRRLEAENGYKRDYGGIDESNSDSDNEDDDEVETEDDEVEQDEEEEDEEEVEEPAEDEEMPHVSRNTNATTNETIINRKDNKKSKDGEKTKDQEKESVTLKKTESQPTTKPSAKKISKKSCET